jgi:nitrate reductase NapAB chaperone NapD
MPICSYLVIPAAGAAQRLCERLSALPGCEVHRARDHDVFILVTETAAPEEDEALRGQLEELKEIRALVLTFGEIRSGPAPEPPPDATESRGKGRKKDRALPDSGSRGRRSIDEAGGNPRGEQP